MQPARRKIAAALSAISGLITIYQHPIVWYLTTTLEFCRDRQIKCFPIAEHIGIVDQITYGLVERMDQQGAGVQYLQKGFSNIAENKLELDISEPEMRDELRGLLHAIVIHAYDLFDLQLDALEVEVPMPGVCFAYDRQTLDAGWSSWRCAVTCSSRYFGVRQQ